jgi:hypothetical protein
MPFGRVNNNPRASIAIGQGIVVIEFLVADGVGHLIQSVTIEVVGLSCYLE